MSTNIKTAMVDAGGTGSGVLVDITTSVTLNQANDVNATTRIFALYTDVAGTYLITGDKQQVAKGGASASAGVGITRIFALYTDVAGTYLITGDKQQVAKGGASASAGVGIKFKAVAGADIYLGDYGPKFRGTVKVSAPSSAAVTTVFYG